MGLKVHVATPPHDMGQELEKEGISFHSVHLTRRGTRPLQELKSILSLYKLYRRIRPDVVHHVTIKPIIYGGIAARLARVPCVISAVSGLGYVYTSRGAKAAALRFIVSTIYRIALGHRNSRIIFQNEDDRQMFLQKKLTNEQETIIIRGSGVNTELYTPTLEPNGKPLVVLAARMLRDKGVCEYVEAVRMIQEEGISARFVLVGGTDPGNPSAISQTQLEKWVHSGVVEWWGHQRDMSSVFAQANLVVLPSYREGVPKVLLEAAACGCAIVATNVPGCRDVVQDGVNGLLAKPRDADSLALAIKKLLLNEDLRAKMGVQGRRIAVQDFSEEIIVEQTLAVYQEILQ